MNKSKQALAQVHTGATPWEFVLGAKCSFYLGGTIITAFSIAEPNTPSSNPGKCIIWWSDDLISIVVTSLYADGNHS